MDERLVRFRVGGLTGQVSEAVWPAHLPLPASELTVIEMPNYHHKGIAVDRNGDYHHCIEVSEGPKWVLAGENNEHSKDRGYR